MHFLLSLFHFFLYYIGMTHTRDVTASKTLIVPDYSVLSILFDNDIIFFKDIFYFTNLLLC